MITLEEINKYMISGMALSSRRVVLTEYPFLRGTAFKLSGCTDELFISDSVNTLYLHSAVTLLRGVHPFRDRCYYVRPSAIKAIYTGLRV